MHFLNFGYNNGQLGLLTSKDSATTGVKCGRNKYIWVSPKIAFAFQCQQLKFFNIG